MGLPQAAFTEPVGRHTNKLPDVAHLGGLDAAYLMNRSGSGGDERGPHRGRPGEEPTVDT